jgi:diguanylate cyclase (GGDEF)-like protein
MPNKVGTDTMERAPSGRIATGLGAARGSLWRLRQGLVGRRDPVFTDLGASGERLVARVRVFLLSVLFVAQLVPRGSHETRSVTLPLTFVALVIACLFLYVATHRERPWLEGFASSAVDVTLVSCGLATFLLLDRPHVAVNSSALFMVYFLAIGCASLRYNAQACALTGLLAIAQYAAIVLYTVTRWSLNSPRYSPFKYGMFDSNAQGMRLILLGAAAVVAAFVVLRAQELRLLSDTDRLTGLANRRAFDNGLHVEAGRARRYWRPLAIVLIDVDSFKQINDTHGHAAGDAVLKSVADILKESMRETDLVARFGGDEFALVLPETTAEMVVAKLERVRHDVALVRTLEGRSASPVRVTLSIGVATWPDDGAQAHHVLAAADARLYEAKRLGRDQLVGPERSGRPAGARPDLASRDTAWEEVS